MQGSFPIAPRPYQHVAAEAGIAEEEVMARVQRLLDERIIRQVTPIFDTRALGYSSMLVAAKVDPENPWRAATIINAHPGVSHNYLRNHEFNIWFTIATEPDSPLGVQGTLDVLAREAGAESVRQLPTLKLFKIRMDLEMEGGTDKLTVPAAEAVAPAETEPQPYDEFDRDVIRALQGDMPVISEPYGPAAQALSIPQQQLLDHLEGMRERRLLRRVAAILFHRRAGFSANGMGVWKVPEGRELEIGGRMAAFRGISHCYQRPDLCRLALLGVHDGPRPLQGGVRRDPRLDRGRHGDHRARDALLLDRVQEDPPAVLHRRASCLGARARRSLSEPHPMTTGAAPAAARSAALYDEALRVLPGGVNSPVRAMGSIGRDPLFIAAGEGAEIVDADGNRYIDWVCSWGPLVLGHADPGVIAAVVEAARRGTSYGAPTEGEVRLAQEIAARVPSVEMVRMTSSGTEASMSAIRLARAVTGREKVLKFKGAYHGHVDGLLAEAGSGLATQGIPSSPGVPESATAATVLVAWNDMDALWEATETELAAILVEGVPANMGLVPPAPGFLELLREAADQNGALLVFDEVISGFRVARGGAQELYGVTPDLTDHGQDHRRWPARRRLRRTARADGADRACRRRLPGGHAVG